MNNVNNPTYKITIDSSRPFLPSHSWRLIDEEAFSCSCDRFVAVLVVKTLRL